MKNLFFTILSIFIIACSSPEKNPNAKIEIFDESILEILDIYSEIEELAELKAQISKYKDEVKSLTETKMVFQENQRSSQQFSEKEMANAFLLAKCMNKADPFDTQLGNRMKAITSVDQFLSNFSSNIYTEMEQQLVIAPMFNRIAVDAKNFRVPVADEDTDGDGVLN